MKSAKATHTGLRMIQTEPENYKWILPLHCNCHATGHISKGKKKATSSLLFRNTMLMIIDTISPFLQAN